MNISSDVFGAHLNELADERKHRVADNVGFVCEAVETGRNEILKRPINRKSYSMFFKSQLWVMTSLAVLGMTPTFACARARAVSASIMHWTYAESEKTSRISWVPKRLRKTLESRALQFMTLG